MFDVSLSELMVIGVVALVVIGPERLPRVARTLGHLLGKLQRYVGQVKADINREMQLDDLKKFQEQMTAEATKIKTSITEVGDEFRNVEATIKESINDGVTSAGHFRPDGLPVSPALTGEISSTPHDPPREATGSALSTVQQPQANSNDDPLQEPVDLARTAPVVTEKS
jgi:sec-independent protein translocase protein TatB